MNFGRRKHTFLYNMIDMAVYIIKKDNHVHLFIKTVVFVNNI